MAARSVANDQQLKKDEKAEIVKVCNEVRDTYKKQAEVNRIEMEKLPLEDVQLEGLMLCFSSDHRSNGILILSFFFE